MPAVAWPGNCEFSASDWFRVDVESPAIQDFARRLTLPHASRKGQASGLLPVSSFPLPPVEQSTFGQGAGSGSGERDMANKLIQSLREVSPRTALHAAISHLFLLGACLWGGLPYVFLQALLAIELLIVSLATIPLYPERGVALHLWDMIKLTAGLAFVLFFILVGYGVARDGGNGNALATGFAGFHTIGMTDIAWASAYLVLHVSMSMHAAMRSDDPRTSWAKNRLADGGATFVALFFMVFVTFFVGRPIVAGLEMFNLHINVDALLSTLMVIVRYVLALIVSLIPDSEMQTMARDPYPDR